MELQEALEDRYSCRNFSDEAPTREQIIQVLEAARLAPTACNFQSYRFYVVTDPSMIERMDAVTPLRYNAQCMIVGGYDIDEAPDHSKTHPEEPWCFGYMDMSSAIVHIMLKAHEIGLETCWLGAFEEKKCHQALGIPDNVAIRAIVNLGYPGEKGSPSSKHTSRKPLEETVTWL